MTDTLDPEDKKLITLARSIQARNGTGEGAAVRDETGRTYAATGVALSSLTLSALEVAVAMAVSGGAKQLEAAAMVTEADRPGDRELAAFREMSQGVLFLATKDGSVKGRYF